MILSDKKIRDLIEKEKLIENYNEKNIQAVSYDVTSSNVIQVFNRILGVVDLRDKTSIPLANKEINIDYGYRIMPNEYILIKTREKFNFPEFLTGHIRPRTTFSRLGLILSDQHVNPTFSGHLYLGLLNATPNTIEIYPDLKIGQMIFEEIEGEISEELLYKNKSDAKYQNEDKFVSPPIAEEIEEEYQRILKRISKK